MTSEDEGQQPGKGLDWDFIFCSAEVQSHILHILGKHIFLQCFVLCLSGIRKSAPTMLGQHDLVSVLCLTDPVSMKKKT